MLKVVCLFVYVTVLGLQSQTLDLSE